MTNKTTEQAADFMQPKEALKIATINQGMLVNGGNKYYPEHVCLSAISVCVKANLASQQPLIDQLQAGCERLRKENEHMLDFIKACQLEKGLKNFKSPTK